MSTREIATASAVAFAPAHVQASENEPWSVVNTATDSSLPCVVMDPNTVLRIAPMNRQFGGWNDAHFHSQLRLPVECDTSNGIVVTCQAMARECVAIALSPTDSFTMGKTYVVHFGAANNVSTVIRRRLENGTEAVDVTIPSRVCNERSWIDYWVVLLNTGKLYVGTGKVVGEQCIGCLDDSLYHQLRPGMDAVKFVGLGNSALGRHARPLKIRNVCVTTVPSYLPPILQTLPTESLPLVNVDDDKSEETTKLMEEYQAECKKNRARAAKFGIPYKEPSPQAFLQWSQARKLRANPEKGFITGMDITSPEELAKQEARKARFGIVDNKKRKGEDDDEQEGEQREQEEQEGTSIMEEDVEPLPVVQAWDNEKLTRPHRVDPPPSLFVNPPPSEEDRHETEEFAMEETATEASLVPEKIHLFGIDWAAFKQIRTDDIMAYFSSYGPSYVEWLGELSCNVLFEDKFSAARALQHMSQELPSPPPPEVSFMADPGQNPPDEEGKLAPPDFGNMAWRFCQQPIRKKSNDRYGRRGTTSRLLMRLANSEDVLVERPKVRPKPPPGFSTKRVLGPGSEYRTEPRQAKRRRVEREPEWDPSSGAEHPALSRGLMSGREGGFSVEELQRERAEKAANEAAAGAGDESRSS